MSSTMPPDCHLREAPKGHQTRDQRPRRTRAVRRDHRRQYIELALAVDEIAERIRALGFPAPGSYSVYAKLPSMQEADGVPDAPDMVEQLVKGLRRCFELHARCSRSLTRSVTSDCGPVDPTDAGSREDGLDAPQPLSVLMARRSAMRAIVKAAVVLVASSSAVTDGGGDTEVTAVASLR